MAADTARVEAAYSMIKRHGTARETTAAAPYLAYGRPSDRFALAAAAA